MSNRNLVFIYARSDSTRLHRKAFADLGGRPLFDIVCARVARLPVDGVALLTTDRSVDDALAAHAEALGLAIVRGDAFDLVHRTCEAIELLQPGRFLRVNGDSPLFEPVLAEYALNRMIKAHPEIKMASNLFRRCFPYGVSVEWFDAAFYVANAKAVRASEREHVSQHLYRIRQGFPALSLEQARDDSLFRLTVDTCEDLAHMRRLAKQGNLLHDSYWTLLGLDEPADLCSVLI